MRRFAIPFVRARKVSFRVGSPDDASVKVVCLALTLALLTLACRIATVW
jgi:hypothetical protein